MRPILSRSLCALLLSAVSVPALAEDPGTALPPLVVTASKHPEPLDQVGASLTVVTREEIERQNYRTLPELLQNVPGLSVVQSGPQGTLTSVFTRGSNSNQTLVLLNGRPIGDPSSPNGAFNFAHLTLFDVQQVEVLRGPSSALYGSQAIGGVINIITRRGEGEPSFSGLVEAGTQGTVNAALDANGRIAGVGYDLTLSRVGTNGFSATPERYRPLGAGAEADGYSNLTGSLALDADLTENLSASLFGSIVDSRVDYDASPEDPNSHEAARQYFINGALEGAFFDGFWQPTLSFGYSLYRRNDKDAPDDFSTTVGDVHNDGSRWSVELQNDIVVDERNLLSLGATYGRESFKSTGEQDFGGGFLLTQDSEADRGTFGLYAIDRFQWDESFFITGAARYDKTEDVDGAFTFTVAPLYRILETGTTLRGSVGTAFKAPSLYELYGYSPNSFGSAFFGNPDLKPERSFGFELGADQSFWDGRLTVGATYFNSWIDDAIVTVYLPTFDSTTVNNRDLRAQGAEVYIDLVPIDSVRLRFDYTFTHTRFEDTDKQALRRPKHLFNGTLDIDLTDEWSITGNFMAAGGMRDVGYLGGEFESRGYTVINAGTAYKVVDGVTLFARAENLLDEQYETADGFQADGLRLLIGLKATY